MPFETFEHRMGRMARQRERYPERADTSLDEIASVDANELRTTGRPLTQFGTDVENTYARNIPGGRGVVGGIEAIRDYFSQTRNASPYAIQRFRNQPTQDFRPPSNTRGIESLPAQQAVQEFGDELFNDPNRRVERDTNVIEPLGNAFDLVFDDLMSAPVLTAIREPDAFLTSEAAQRTEDLQEEGFIAPLRGSGIDRALGLVPFSDKDIAGSDLSLRDIGLGAGVAFADLGTVIGIGAAPDAARALRAYQQLTAKIPVGLSVRDVSGEMNTLRAVLNIADDVPDAEAISQIQRMRQGIRAVANSPARDPNSESVQIARQQLDLIDTLLPKVAAQIKAVDTTDARGILEVADHFIARDRNTGQYVMGSGSVTPDRNLAATFLSEDDLRAFADSQPFPVDPIRVTPSPPSGGGPPRPPTTSGSSGPTPRRRSVRPTPPTGPQPVRPATGPSRSAAARQLERAQASRPVEAVETVLPRNQNIPTAPRGAPSGAANTPPGFQGPPTSTQVRSGIESARAAREAAENAPAPRNPNIPTPPRGIPEVASSAPRGYDGAPTSAQVRRAVAKNRAEATVPIRAVTEEGQKSAIRKLVDIPFQVLGTARSFKASIDISMPFRQGALSITRREWWESWKPMLRALYDGQYADELNDELLGGPLTQARAARGNQDAIAALARAEERQAAGLSLTRYGAGVKLSDREEGFVVKWADRIPLIKQSSRAAVTFLNSVRAGVFDNSLARYKGYLADGAISEGRLENLKRGLARWTNIATTRADLTDPRQTSDLLNAANQSFFSARALIARFQALQQVGAVINPWSGMDPIIRREVARDVAGFISAGSGALYVMHEAGWIDVNLDPRSSDFAKGRVPLTGERYDPWAGFQQIARYGTQLWSNERVNEAGDIVPIEGGRSWTALRFLRSKLAPGLPTIVVDALTGETFLGDPLETTPEGLLKYAGEQYIPLSAAEIYEAGRAEGAFGVAKSLPSQVGVGYNRYQGLADVRDAAALEVTEGQKLYRDLNKAERRAVNEVPEVQKKLAEWQETPEERDDPANLDSGDRETLFQAHARFKETSERELKSLIVGGISGEALRESINQFKSDLYVSGRVIFDGPLEETFKDLPSDAPIEDLLADLYWSAPASEQINALGDLSIDYDQQNEAREEILRFAQANDVDVNYIIGTGEDTYRGKRFDDDLVRETVTAFEDTKGHLESTGYWDMRQEAWLEFREIYPELSEHNSDYWAWREEEYIYLTGQFETEGSTREAAKRQAKAALNGYETVSQFNEFYRTTYRHEWVTSFPDLASVAWDLGYLDPDSAEFDFLVEYNGGIAEQPTASSGGSGFFGAGFGGGFSSGFGR